MYDQLHMLQELLSRPRRNRKSASIRRIVQETHLQTKDLVAPLFLIDGKERAEEIEALKGVYRFSLDHLLKECHHLLEGGITSIMLFPVVDRSLKDARGSFALETENFLFPAISSIKSHFPELLVMVDVALDPYTDHGHDGVVDHNYHVMNDETVEILAKLSLLLAQAGADIVAPSDMMDGRVQAIRQTLDSGSYKEVGILSYAAKYASSFYGPFREIVGSSNLPGDKKGYQLNPANIKEALLEAKLDEEEGADLLLVKPALPYLDVIAKVKEKSLIPVGAYHVSGEYAQLQAAAHFGLLDFEKALMESLISIKRAGADFILTYGAKTAASLLP